MVTLKLFHSSCWRELKTFVEATEKYNIHYMPQHSISSIQIPTKSSSQKRDWNFSREEKHQVSKFVSITGYAISMKKEVDGKNQLMNHLKSQ